ncbi:MiaB/RimO family radical SAM methylthiotransferase [Candidatus Palauibacter sp.]|uniref:MiaB/RimO family radical SAM methylthiotransferase n=1 Tax=Candidatus Palauibacter sp. TaxID=3101350 RepID=UPI003CC5F72D
MSDRPAVWFHTFGCKANQYDTERIRQELELRGAETAPDADAADVAVINTCTVTNQADANARHLVRRLRRRHPDLRIIVAGCSTAFREADYRDLDEVDGVVPGHDPAAVAQVFPGLERGPAAIDAPLARNARGTRAWLKIQDGCDRKCSFCATRIARGASLSRPPDEIVAEAAILARSHPELVITGIHIGHYGRDLEPEVTLAELCERLLERVPARFRLSSIEATKVDDRLVDLLAESGGRLAPHLHVPLQSGSDRVLRLMRRWHTREAYRSRVLAIAERVGAMGLGADIIVGFPGEGEEEFAETHALVEELPFTYLHVFPYSVRDGTVAATLPDQVRGDVAAGRSRALRDLGLRKGREYEATRVGEMADIVVEGRDDRVLGVTGDYLKVELIGRAVPGDRFSAVLGGRAGSLAAGVPEAAAV